MPVRKIPIGTRAVTGMHARSGARYESSLERDFFEMMINDSTVEKIEEQPVKINYVDSNGKQRKYTPDALVLFKPNFKTGLRRPPLLCEVKYRAEYREKFHELRERFCAARKFARNKGWQFKVVTDREIRTAQFSNQKFFSGFKERVGDANYARLFLDIVQRNNGLTIEALLTEVTTDFWKRAEIVPTLWWLIANEKVKVDMATPITMKTNIFPNA